MRWVSIITSVVISLVAISRPNPAKEAEWLVLKVTPRAIQAGGAVRLECRIPKHRENRAVELGIVGVRTSAITLNGDREPVLHSLLVENIPCEGTEAYCLLYRTGGEQRLVKAEILVGCDSGMNLASNQ